MTTNANHFSMAELVTRTSVPAATIRYYSAQGLLPPPTKVSANRFLYDERHVEAIRLVRLLRDRRGLSLEAIRDLLPDLVPDVLGKPEGGVFHPEMWGDVIERRRQNFAGPSVARRLVEAGLVAFANDGYAEVTIDQICQATAIAKGSFYRHYASKEELFFAVAREAGAEIVVRYERSVGAGAADSENNEKALVDAVWPFFAIFLDLSTSAARHRPGHGAVLAELADRLNAAARFLAFDQTDLFPSPFERALGGAIRRVIEERESAESVPFSEPIQLAT